MSEVTQKQCRNKILYHLIWFLISFLVVYYFKIDGHEIIVAIAKALAASDMLRNGIEINYYYTLRLAGKLKD